MRDRATQQLDIALKRALCWDQLADEMRSFAIVDGNGIKPVADWL